MGHLLQKILRICARGVIKRYKPFIIGVTGSVGKTSTREAIVTVLKESCSVRSSLKNYNNEIGLPLTVIGELSPGSSLYGWMLIVAKAFWLILKHDPGYPEVLVLEYAADRKGDIEYLRTTVPPHTAVITYVANVHLEYFDSVKDIAREKFSIIQHMDERNYVFINGDVEDIKRKTREYRDKKFITYGFSHHVNIRAYRKQLRFDKANPLRPIGIDCDVSIEKETIRVFLPGVISDAHIYAVLPAVGIAYYRGVNLQNIVSALKNYHVPVGRMKLIPGVKGTMLIDDTYNSSPVAVRNAVDTLHTLPVQGNSKRWVVLGDMLELGRESEKEHRDIGRYIFASGMDYLVTVGMRAKGIANGAVRRGMSKDSVYSFDSTGTAGKFIEGRIQIGDIVLVKGSQGARMERVVKEIMADPLRSGDLLVRQDASWK